MKRSIYGSLIGLSIAVTTLFIAGCGSDTTVASKNEAKTETSSLSKSSNDSTTESTEAVKKRLIILLLSFMTQYKIMTYQSIH